MSRIPSSALRPKSQVNCPNLKSQPQTCIQPSTVEHPPALGNNANVDIALRAKGLVSIDVVGDGNCFFRAVSVCMDGVEDNHIQLRQKTVEYMKRNRVELEGFFSTGPDRDYSFLTYPLSTLPRKVLMQ